LPLYKEALLIIHHEISQHSPSGDVGKDVAALKKLEAEAEKVEAEIQAIVGLEVDNE
jgi:hypothetical protein